MKKFHLTDNYALINFDAINNKARTEIVSSTGFKQLFDNYYRSLKKSNSYLLSELQGVKSNDIGTLFKLLLIYDLDEGLEKMHRRNTRVFGDEFLSKR